MESSKAPVYYSNPPQSNSMGVGLALLLGILGLGGYYFYSSNKKDENANDEAKKLTDKPTQWASRISNALGNMIQQPNITELIAIAREINDWPAVVEAYKRLYNSNIEDDVKSKLQIWGGYQDFLTALSKKGLPGTKTDNIVVQPKATTVKKGDKLFLDDSKYPVEYYKDWRDYPIKKLATVPVGKIDPKKRQVTFIQAIEASYAGSNVKTTLYQVSLSNNLVVWINRDRNIVKKAGTAGFFGSYTEIFPEVA